MQAKDQILKLTGKVQHYAWGGHTYIAQLLGTDNPQHLPMAEYWMGAHPSAPSQVQVHDKAKSLHTLIANDPVKFLGAEVNERFHELPYLLKVLDVEQMLSIQVHPSRQEAIEGYEREEAAGIPIDAPHRNYKDKNHKPEVMVALSEFWLLHGFKETGALEQVLTEVPAFHFLQPTFKNHGYYGLYKTVMELPQQKVDEILRPLVEGLLADKKGYSKVQPEYWTVKLFEHNTNLTGIDRGIFSIYFFNIVQAQPGEAVFQGAGIPHAYLQGQNVELMANSDNVLRGGLTPKHIDVPELLKHTLFEGITPNVLKGERNGAENNYPCPVDDFGISTIHLGNQQEYHATSRSAEIYVVIDGEATIEPLDVRVKKGEAFFVLPGTSYTLKASEPSILYKAFVP